MVRETRHLWVGNLPENVREDRIRDHFKRYGRVQSVKLLPREKDDEGSGVCATVSFMDIKSASKAHNNEQKLEERTLTTEYHEPAAIPGSGPPLYSSQRFSHGPPDEISTFERSSHFYERERDRRDGDAYLRRASSTYHVTAADNLRGRTRDRHYRNGPYTPIIESVVSRQPPHHRTVGSAWTYETPSRYPQPATTPDVYADDRRDLTPVVVVHKKHTKSRSGSSGSNSGSSVSRSRSSSSSSQSGSSSCSSASSSPASDKSCSTHSHHGSLRSGVTLQSAVSTPHTNNSSPAVHSDDRRPLAICVRNLPARSSDTSLKDGLFHEYKKHGKVTWVKVVGQGSDRYALVCFKKPEDVEKALQVSHDKLFFGCKIEVAPYQGYDVDDNEFRFVARPYEAEQDEFHPKATRTLFIGNLEKDITAPDLRKHFDQFGEIIEIDIKKQGSNSSYAFCQYCDIGSVVRAIRTLDGEHLGNNRIKLGFGKSLHTNCVWVDGVAESVTEKYLSLQFSQFGPVSHVAVDRSRGHALVFYDQIAFAQSAVKEMRGVAVRGRKLQVDFASRECQEAFYDHLEKQTGHNSTFDNSLQVSPQGVTTVVTRGFETPSSSSSSIGSGGGGGGGGGVRYPRYSSQPSVTRCYTRSASAVSPGASPSTPARSTPRHVTTTPRFDLNLDYLSERRPYRSYEEMAAEDGGGIVTVTVGQGPQDIRHLQKERVALLEQLEDCASSGEEGSSRRRCKHRRSHSGDGSRPGTPLCDERPENLPPVEPRRTPRERPPDPLSLPLPRFATQLLSPRPAPPSPPASPPRPKSTSSDDSEPSPPSPEWEERLRSLDEKYEKWSGSRTVMTKVDQTTLKVRHKLLDLDLHELQPSDIVKSVLAKRSVFDEDSKRLENFGEKYEPRGEFVPTRPGFTPLRPRMESPLLHSPSAPKSPAAASTPAGAKGLQYPFPSHPPVQPTTSVATTTAAMSIASCSSSSISSGIVTLSPNTSMEGSKSLQTFLTSCISSVPSIRQFQTPPSPFHAPPKISPSAPSEKKAENVDPRLDRSKNPQKLLQPPSPVERLDPAKKDVLPLTSLKPLKSCLRRDSGDDRGESDGRRRSREEDSKVQVLKSECDRGKEQEMLDKRRSLTDPRRRDSVDSNIDGFRCESVSDKIKERNHKEDRRRRDSIDSSAIKKDTEVSDTVKSRLSDSRVSEQPDTLQCSNFTSTLNSNLLSQHDDNLRHSQPTDTLEKKKDSIQICPERDRRRGRESTDSCSDSSRNKKVPDSLDVKRELESDTRQRDMSLEKNDSSCKKSLDFVEKITDSNQSENVETLDRRKEKDCTSTSQESTRQREKKETSSKKDKEGESPDNSRHRVPRKSPESTPNQRHKEHPKPSLHLDNARHRERTYRGESESSEDNFRNEDKKEPENTHQNYCKVKDPSYRKEVGSNEALHNLVNKLEEINDKNDPDAPNNKHKENNRHLDYSRQQVNDRKKDSLFDSLQSLHKEIKREDETEPVKLKSHDFLDSELRHSTKQLNCDNTSLRLKDHERRKDGEKIDSKLKNINDAMESAKTKSSDKSSGKETINQISEWVEEIRKDLESSGFAKSREPMGVDSNFDRKAFDTNQIIEVMKLDDKQIHQEIKKEDDFGSTYKENDRRKHSDCYEKKRSCDTAEIFRRKEIAFKKELNDIDVLKIKDADKKKDNDLLDNFKHKSYNEKRKEGHDREIHKESFDFEKKSKNWLDDDKKADDKAKQFMKELERSDREYDFDSFENKKDYENKLDFVDHHEEGSLKKIDLYKKEKKKERLNSWPAAIGGKRRLSSQDSLDVCSDESKKSKPERRDSKDSCRSSSSSSKKSNCEKYNKSFTKLLEEKIREDKEKELNKKKKEEDLFDLTKMTNKREKKISGERRRDEQKQKIRSKENGITASESETGSGDDDSKMPKKHSIFDIVDEEPAYISMYDKVKARSTKNMQKQEEEKRQERLKEKFNQLKQSRAKREEKKRSTSYDEDSDSERGGRRSNKLMITSSEEDACSEGDLRTKGRKIMSDTSEDDTHRNLNISRTKPSKINLDDFETKPRKVMSETSEDDTVRFTIGRMKEVSNHHDDLVPKMRKILSDTSEDDIMKRSSSISKSKLSRIQSDESEVDLAHEDRKKNDFVKKTNDYTNSDLFSNISEDPEHPHSDFEKEPADPLHRNSIDSISDVPRKKSHKKKQKRQKNSEEGEDGSIKRHSSKKDRRKSSHSHDGDDDQSMQSKSRKKKNRENSSKRDGKMEDIFGPLSDDSDKGRGKWNVSQIYGSDSDEERQLVRKREKRRKERKARELDEAGRALEAKLMEPYENLQHLEDHAKSKKKKRKKSREERMSKHHQQRLEEAAERVHEADSEHEPEPSVTNIPPPSLPRLMDSPPPSLNQNKKPDIPGFGSQVDENIHETAVKSISESPIKALEVKQELIEEPPQSNSEDKPTPVISQEETEDAVAALLLEDSFGGSGGFETYTKPDTPVSEPDLQIDTDTEDTFDAIDFSRPPRTPDIPTSFYRQQDTREGLEERILAMACPDNSSGKPEEGSTSPSSPKPLQISSSRDSDQESKTTEHMKDTERNTRVDTKLEVSPEGKNKESHEKPVSNPDTVKRHDLPSVCQSEVSLSAQPVKAIYNEVAFNKVNDPPLPKISIGKNSNQPEKSSVISQMPTKTLLPPTPPPLLHTSIVSAKDVAGDVNKPLSVKPAPISDTPKLQTVNTQSNHPVFSAQDVHRTPVQSSDTHVDKSPMTPKPLNQIIVSPPTSVALIVQTQPKLSQTGQQSTVLHMTTKIHSPGNAQVEIKGNSQMSYMIHHSLPQSQTQGSQGGGNRLTTQQPPSQIHQGSHKLSISTSPTCSKSPGLTSAKSPGIPGTTKSPLQDQQFKQIVINHPHNQQLSVNVSHSHHVNANLLLSPGHQLNVSHSPSTHHSQATLSFSPHHIKVPLAQQHINSLNSNVLQLSPNIHQQVSPLSNNQQKGTQHSPASHQLVGSQPVASNLQLKSGTHLLQPVANCVGSVPGKLMSPTSGTKTPNLHNFPGLPVRHLSPVTQQNTVHKINAHVIQSPSNVQQVRAVVVQNQSKQTVTLLQSQVVQRIPGNQIVRPSAPSQSQTIQTLKANPPLLIEKNKLPPEATSDSPIVKKELCQISKSESAPKAIEEAFLKKLPTKEDIKVSVKDDDARHTVEVNKLTNKHAEENKLLSPLIQDLSCKTSPAKRSPSPMAKSAPEDKVQKSTKPSGEGINEMKDSMKSVELKEALKPEDEAEQSTDKTPDLNTQILPIQKHEMTKRETFPEEKSNNSKEVNQDVSKLNMGQPPTEDKSLDSKQNPETSKILPKKEEKPSNQPLEEPKVEKIRIIKEENGLCIDSTPARPVKLENHNQNHDKGHKTEVKEESNDKSLNEIEENHLGEETSEHSVSDCVTTATTGTVTGGRGRGGRRRKASGRVGGVVTRRARLNSSVVAATEDVYEFKDDSEEEARPRLILTIKSPPDPVVAAASAATTTTTNAPPASPPSQPAAPTPTSTSASTSACRKSRRLQEKDGSKSTIDDTIEDVIRSTRSGRRTVRTRAASPAPEPRKSPRRKQSVPGPAPASVPVISAGGSETPAVVTGAEPSPPAPTPVPVPAPTPAPVPAPPQPGNKPQSTEPMTLIDPVTGLLIPMRESEEGQYIPVNTDHIRPVLESKEESGEPVEKRARTTLPTESEASLLSRPGKVPPNCAVVPPLPPKQSVAPLIKPVSGIPRPTTTPNPLPLTKPLTINPPPITAINKASVTNVVGPMTINRVVAPPVSPSGKPALPNISSTTPLNHKSHLVQAVPHRGKVPVAKVPAPMTPKQHILHSITNVGREGMLGPGTPPPPHHGALLTGSVASPPLRAPHHISQQPVVTGASSTRVVCKGLEPLKVEPGSCIVVPSASPQSRSQVLQAGLPVPAYEASLGEVVQHVNFPPHHIQPAHYVHPQLVYQQYLREAALTGYHLPSGVKTADVDDRSAGVVSSPPLELRRGSPHDRTTDSPQVATVYVHGSRHLYFEPPPAHRPSQPRLQVATPPHASQVPPQADSLLMLLQRYPVMWQGLLALKTDQAAVQMHFVFGNPHVARDSLPCNSDGSTPPLRIAQRMRLEQTQVEGVARKMQMDNEHCMLLALPCGRDHMDVLQQSNNLQSGFITYLQQKQAAGIVNIAGPGSQQAAYVVHIFPSCDFANESLARIAPDLLHRVANIAHLLIVIATV